VHLRDKSIGRIVDGPLDEIRLAGQQASSEERGIVQTQENGSVIIKELANR
jgi:hypothetical protein